MIDFQTLKKQADELRKAKKYAEALPLYQKLWEEYQESCSEWEGWGYAFCLKQQKQYAKALEVSREVYKLNHNFENIKNVYAWAIYFTEISIDKIQDENKFLKAAEAIVKLSKQDAYSPYKLTVFKVIEFFENKVFIPFDKILEWTAKLDDEILEDKSFSFSDKEGKIRESASDKEKFFMWRTKALLEQGYFEECIQTCKKALNTLSHFHYDNDVWFNWRIALSYKGLKQIEKALNELKNLLRRKNDWFVLKEISEIYFEQENYELALKFAVDSALSTGEIDKKLNLLSLLSYILIKLHRTEEAQKHIHFIYHFRKSKDWKIDQSLQSLINKFPINNANSINLKYLEKELKKIWENIKFANQKEFFGTIKSMLPNSKSGFIETDDKQTYFFHIKNFKAKPEWAKVGQPVNFFLEEGFDKKKNKKTMNAVNIKPIKNFHKP